jgi:molybdopterin converting factor small subunit
MTSETEEVLLRSVDELYEGISDRIRDVRERKNRGALLINIVEPLEGEDKPPARGDTIEVVSADGQLKDAEVINANLMVAFHPDYGPTPCVSILAEILDPNRMTLDDFESLYGEENSQEETEELGTDCECGAVRSDCEQNQELFGLHVNSDYDD